MLSKKINYTQVGKYFATSGWTLKQVEKEIARRKHSDKVARQIMQGFKS